MDARDLSPSIFGEDQPEVILHEIFGENALSESVISVFSSLKEKGFLEKAELLPRFFEIRIEPVFSQKLSTVFNLEDFEGYPLSQMTKFGGWKTYMLEAGESADDWVSVGTEEVLVKIDLMKPEVEDFYLVKLKCEKPCSHLRLSLRLLDEVQGTYLDSSHGRTQSHWKNVYYSIPEWQSSNLQFEARFEVDEEQLYLTRVTPLS
jgi:hypothetical protein